MNDRLHRKAFSLIEILVVVALIGVLSTLLIIGVSKLKNNSKRQQTQLMFQNLQGMFSDYDASSHMAYGAGSVNFNNIPANAQTQILQTVALPCPTNVTTAGIDNQGNAVQSTRDFMAAFSQNPAIAAALSKLPASSLMTFHGPSITNPTAWSVGTLWDMYAIAEFTDANSNVGYFRRMQLYNDVNGTSSTGYGSVLNDTATQSPPDPTYWIPAINPSNSNAVAITIPVVLDGWGNPIIFVAGGVLGAYPGATSGGNFLTAGGNNIQVKSPNLRPFFASAGADGDFSKGDDNMYSFEK